MNRRNFLKNSSLAGLSVSAATSQLVRLPKKKIPETAAGKPVSDEFPLNELTVEALQEKNELR